MLTNGFTVFHKDSNLSIKLGRGFVIGELQQKTTITTQGTVVKDGQEVNAVFAEEQIVIHYQVLWENARNVSPSLHASTELTWEMLTEEYLDITSDDGEEEEEESEEADFGADDNENVDDTTTATN